MELKIEFFENLTKAFISDLKSRYRPFEAWLTETYGSEKSFPIYIHSTGDMFYDYSITDVLKVQERGEIVTTKIPRMVLDVLDGTSIELAQFSNPHVQGRFADPVNGFDTYYANVRRIPLIVPINGVLFLDNIFQLWAFQEISLRNCYAVKQFDFLYNGVTYSANIKFEDAFKPETKLAHDYEGGNTKNIKMPFSFSIDAQFPAFDVDKSLSRFNQNKRIMQFIWNEHLIDKDMDTLTTFYSPDQNNY